VPFQHCSFLLPCLQAAEGLAEAVLALSLIHRVDILRASLTDVRPRHLSVNFIGKFVISAHVGAQEWSLRALLSQVVPEQLIRDTSAVAPVNTLEDHA